MSRIYTNEYLISRLGKPSEIESRLVAVKVETDLPLKFGQSTIIKTIRSHPICAQQLFDALQTIRVMVHPHSLATIGFYEFGGGYVNRRMRGGTKLSAHAFGIAFDFSPTLNGLKTTWKASSFNTPDGKKVVEILEMHGFVNYGKQFNYDPMHFEFANV